MISHLPLHKLCLFVLCFTSTVKYQLRDLSSVSHFLSLKFFQWRRDIQYKSAHFTAIFFEKKLWKKIDFLYGKCIEFYFFSAISDLNIFLFSGVALSRDPCWKNENLLRKLQSLQFKKMDIHPNLPFFLHLLCADEIQKSDKMRSYAYWYASTNFP